MANIANPRKQFNFSISTPGLNPFLAQKVTLPDFEIDVVEHGDTNYDVKTGGRAKFGQLMIEKIATATGPDNWVWEWMQEIQDVFVGGGFLPSIYKRTIEIFQYSTDGVAVINRWRLLGCWPNKINGVELDRLGSDNTMESLEFCVDQPSHGS